MLNCFGVGINHYFADGQGAIQLQNPVTFGQGAIGFGNFTKDGDHGDDVKCAVIERHVIHIGDAGLDIANSRGGGVFPEGSSPYGCEDLSGNVWEWTRSQDAGYPYVPGDGREKTGKVTNSTGIILRGGAYYSDRTDVRSAQRAALQVRSDDDHNRYGFRVVVSPFISDR